MRFDPDRNAYTLEGQYKYDIELGELHELADGVLKKVIEVRTSLEDQLILNAVIFELQKRGYHVFDSNGVEISMSRSQKSQGT